MVILVLIGLAVFVLPALREQLAWRSAQRVQTLEAYREYELNHARGRHLSEARAIIEQLVWEKSTHASSVESFATYLRTYPTGRFEAEARRRHEVLLEDSAWQSATNTNTIRSFSAYTGAYPKGRFAGEAQAAQAALRVDDQPFSAALRKWSENARKEELKSANGLPGHYWRSPNFVAMQKKTEAALREFLSEFPGHAREAVVQQTLKEFNEGRDIVDLLQEKRIEMDAYGSGIKYVGLRVRKLVPYPLTVRIPVGSYFVPANLGAQNMVATSEEKVRLLADDWKSTLVNVACANRPRGVPGSSDTFSVQRSPQQEELVKLMPALDRAGVEFPVRQAAVWIVTDNADYNDLGILVASQFGFGGSRTIKEPETAQAMKICWEAGIDITRKNIWRARQMILAGLPNKDAELKRWLEGKR